MIRCTSAHVDLDATRANYRAIADYLGREAALNRGAGKGPVRRRASSPSSRRTPTGTARFAWRGRSRKRAPAWLAVADIEEGIELREAGTRARILVFGALSVSDLDGVFEYDLTPTIAHARGGPGAAEGGDRARYALSATT